MKKRLTALALAFVMVMGTAAVAAGVEKTISVTPMGMTINGQTVTPLKSDGTPAEVFAYDGATYVPLRYLSELLGITVEWDKNDPNTAKLVSDKITVPAQPSVSFKAGTYTGVGKGRNGNVSVEVVFTDSAISSVTVKEHGETAGICDPAIEKVPQSIVTSQSLGVDTITGATLTSDAILEAVASCVKQAGGNVEALKNKAVNKVVSNEKVTKTADLVVLGGGGAGLSAALAAAEQGATVIVVEKSANFGGNTVLAGGGFNAYDPSRQEKQEMTSIQLATVDKILSVSPKSDLHKKLLDTVAQQLKEYKSQGKTHIFDSPEFHALQTYDGGDYLGNLEVIYTYTRRASEMLGLLNGYGLTWKEKVTTYVGALWPRSHEALEYKSGLGFIETFKKVIAEKNYPVEYVMECTAETLITENGKVTGATATGADGTQYTFQANKGVILATGGFSANKEMIKRYKPDWPSTLMTTNAVTITGDGIAMAEAVGANLIDMDQVQILPTSSPVHGGSPGYVGESAGMYINKEGKRFVNEYERRDVLTAAVFAQTDSIFYIVTNQKNSLLDANGNNKFGENINDLIATKQVFKGETVEDLANQLGMDPAVLRQTFDTWNEDCHNGIDPEFGRNNFNENVWLEEGPYYAAPRSPSIHHTMGGVQVNTSTQVINTQGNVIPGLYAAGEVTGGIHGSNRLGGNAVPDALANGRAAGLVACGLTPSYVD